MTDYRYTVPAGAEQADGRLGELDRYVWELARDFRDRGAALDRDPDDTAGLAELTGGAFYQQTFLPPRYQRRDAFPPALLETASTVLGSTIMSERLAFGDPGVALAMPGPSLSGAAVAVLADETMLERYVDRVTAAPIHTFFALTEPNKGSAATELETTLRPAPDGEGWLLDGEKCYIGNGARAELGVVFARRLPGRWGTEAVLVDSATAGFSATTLPSVGLRGAAISRLRFDGVRVPPENLLGAHRPRSRRGLRGALNVLYRTRPGLCAFAVGCAQAACDYLTWHRPHLPSAQRHRLDGLLDRIAAVRRSLYRVCALMDHGSMDNHWVSAVKVKAARLAEEATLVVAELLGPASLIEHPWLEKTYRDVRAFDIMEGAANVHLLTIFQGITKGSFSTGRSG